MGAARGRPLVITLRREDEVKKVETWLEKALIDGMARGLNGPNVEGSRVPVEVETQVAKTWAG
jgi:hypothetical protein